MSQVIVFTKAGGGCSVADVAGDAAIADVAVRVTPPGGTYVIVDRSELPSTSPDAWSIVNGAIVSAAGAASAIRPQVDLIRLNMVLKAYVSQEKRISLYGYMSELVSYVVTNTATDEQKADLAVLQAASRWEQSLIDAVDSVSALGLAAAQNPSSWPTLAADKAAALTALANAS